MRKNLHHLPETTYSLISLPNSSLCVSHSPFPFPPCSLCLSVALHLSQICCQKWRQGLFLWERRAEMERWSKHCRYITPLLILKVHWLLLRWQASKIWAFVNITAVLCLISRTRKLCFEGRSWCFWVKTVNRLEHFLNVHCFQRFPPAVVSGGKCIWRSAKCDTKIPRGCRLGCFHLTS